MGKIVHVDKFMQGTMTPNEVHRKYAYGTHKCECGLPPAGRILSFASVVDMTRDEERRARLQDLTMRNEGRVPMVKFTYGDFVKLGETFFCDLCQSTAEKAAARLPDWVLTEIDRGPDPHNSVSAQVPGNVVPRQRLALLGRQRDVEGRAVAVDAEDRQVGRSAPLEKAIDRQGSES